MRRPHPIYADIDASLTVTRMANGWQVMLPRIYPEENTRQDITDGMASGLQEMIPVFKELMKIKDRDPLLSSLQDQETEENTKETPNPEPDPLIGQQKYFYVFATFREVLEFLDDKFTGEDGY